MIPPKSDPRWSQLVAGKLKHSFKVTSAAMFVSRLQRHIQQDSSPEMIQKSVDELHAFFSKFESVVKEDLKAIFG